MRHVRLRLARNGRLLALGFLLAFARHPLARHDALTDHPLPVRQLHHPVHHVGRQHAGQVDGVLGSAKLRRVAQLRLSDVVHGASKLNGHGDHVHSLLHTLLAHRLQAQDAARLAVEHQLHVDRVRARVVRHMVTRVQLHHRHVVQLSKARALQEAIRASRHGDRVPEQPAHCRALHAPECTREAADRLRRHARLTVRWTRQRQVHGLTRHNVGRLHRVPNGEDAWVRRAHLVRHADGTTRSQIQPRLPCQRALRTHANGQDHHVRRKLLARLRVHAQRRLLVLHGGLLLDLGQPIAQDQLHASLAHSDGDQRSQILVQGRHHVVQHLDHRRVQAQLDKILAQLQPDEPTAHDHRALGVVDTNPALDLLHVRNGAHAEHALRVHARQRRLDGRRSRRKHQVVVRELLRLPLAARRTHVQHLALAIDAHRLRVAAHVHVEPQLEHLWRRDHQRLVARNHAGHRVREATVRERDESAALDDGDLCGLIQPTQTGCA
mmetsp:Transcript_4696/g.15227  ORF Transcript_4696/g.15227 Transcript_4696/m.15227 type:complete len:494 (-) Transcript_4696:97-1578(-)